MGNSIAYHFMEGMKHITDFNGYDHLVFLLALCAVYDFSQWKRVLILVTAFTIGHSLTLISAGLDIVVIPSHVAEFLIPCTILLTALFNLRETKEPRNIRPGKLRPGGKLKYFVTLLFGMIHGFGFSNYFRMIRVDEGDSILTELLFFNIGVEAGQILIVIAILILATIMMGVFKFRQRAWILFASGIAAGISLILIQDTWLF